jgi:CDP-diacylglycerol--serine O-phosphatidyltransferase
MFAGKTLGVKVPRSMVAPIFVVVILAVGLLVSYPFEMLSLIVLAYFAMIPWSVAKYRALERADEQAARVSTAESKPDAPPA